MAMTRLRSVSTRVAIWAGAVAIVGLVAGVAAGVVPPLATPGDGDLIGIGRGETVEVTDGRHFFYISGSVEGLYPGLSTELPLEVQNPNDSDIQVSSIGVRARSSNRPGCPATNVDLVVHPYSGPPFLVPAHQTVDISVPIEMPASVRNACQGAKFRIQFRGQAVQVP
jgi:hypothetical protein